MTTAEMRQLDVWIAEHVMGWKWCHFGFVKDGLPELSSEPIYLLPPERLKSAEHGNANPFPHDKVPKWKSFGATSNLPYYSSDPASAFAVLEKCILRCDESGDSVDLSFTKQTGQFDVGRMQLGFEWSIELPQSSASLPLSICLFAKQLFSK